MNLEPIKAPATQVKKSLNIPSDLVDELNDYSEYYEVVWGNEVKFNPLVVKILESFIAKDKGFQKYVKSGKNKDSVLKLNANANVKKTITKKQAINSK